MFFCKENFGDVPKALSVKGLDGLSDTSNFLDRLNFSVIVHFSICTLPFTLFGSGSSGLGIPMFPEPLYRFFQRLFYGRLREIQFTDSL